MRIRHTALLCGALAVSFAVAVPAQAADPVQFPVQYMVKFVCGFVVAQPTGEEPPVKPGNYATAINIYNHTDQFLDGAKRVNLHYREDGPLPPIISSKNFLLFKRRVLEIDCVDIWSLVGVPPSTFLKGMVHIGLPVEVPVAAVYTSQTNIAGAGQAPDVGAGISIDVEYIAPFAPSMIP